MKIYSGGSNRREAYRVGGTVYKCYPVSTNTVDEAREFAKLEDAAVFLIRNRGWGIRMNPGSSIIYDNIVIDLS